MKIDLTWFLLRLILSLYLQTRSLMKLNYIYCVLHTRPCAKCLILFNSPNKPTRHNTIHSILQMRNLKRGQVTGPYSPQFT